MVSNTVSQVASGVQPLAQPLLVKNVDGIPRVSSLDVAERFDKRHTHVLRVIKSIMADLPEDFRQPNFGLTFIEIPGPNGSVRKSPVYSLTRDAFSLVAMGFTGKEALAWKVCYIKAFNAMENHILHPRPTATLLPYQVIRTLPKPMKDRLNDLVDTKLTHVSSVHHWRARMRMWKRFNEAFRIPRHDLLPEVRMIEAVTFLTGLDVGHGGTVTCKAGLAPLPMNAAQTTVASLTAMIKQGESLVAALSVHTA